MSVVTAASARPEQQSAARANGATVTNYFYLAPAVLMVVVFVYYALFFNAEASLYDWDGISRDRYFIGIENFQEILSDRTFLQALVNTLIWSGLSVFLLTSIGFVLAALMSADVRAKGFFSAIIIFPSITATVVVATVARQVFAADGEFNALLSIMGLGSLSRAWLADPGTALYGLTAAHIWQWTGFSFLLYYAALTLVNQEVVEAAYLDGASLWQIIWRVLFPMCRPTTYALVTLGIIQSLKTFDIVYLTTGGGPGTSSEMVSTYLFDKALLDGRAGYSASISVVLVAIAIVSTATFMWLQQRRASGE
jgi:raffinose/stachyose/melibiose transport system permease protein